MKLAPSLHLAQPKHPCWHGLCRRWSPTSCAHEVPEPSSWAQPLDAWASVLGSVSVFSFSLILLPGDCFTCCHWNEHKRRMYVFMIPIFYLSKSNKSILRKNCQLRHCDLFGSSQCMNLIRARKRRCPFLACARAPVVQWPSWWQLMTSQLSSENAMWQTKSCSLPPLPTLTLGSSRSTHSYGPESSWHFPICLAFPLLKHCVSSHAEFVLLSSDGPGLGFKTTFRFLPFVPSGPYSIHNHVIPAQSQRTVGLVTPWDEEQAGQERVLGCHLRVCGACSVLPTSIPRPVKPHPH